MFNFYSNKTTRENFSREVVGKKSGVDPAKALERIEASISRINARERLSRLDKVLLKFIKGRKKYFENILKEKDGN